MKKSRLLSWALGLVLLLSCGSVFYLSHQLKTSEPHLEASGKILETASRVGHGEVLQKAVYVLQRLIAR